MVFFMQSEVSKSQFKAKALEMFREVETTNNSIIVTDHGKPTIEVRKYIPKDNDPLQTLRGSVTEYVEPDEPVGLEDWEVLN